MPLQRTLHRVVITGVGAVTPIGNTAAEYWQNLSTGVSGVAPITAFDATGFDVQIAAEVKKFDPTDSMDRKMARRMSRFIHFGMAAAQEAIADSGVDLLRQLVKRGRRDGSFRNDVPVEWLVSAFFSLIHTARDDVTAGRLRERSAQEALSRTVPDLFRGRAT